MRAAQLLAVALLLAAAPARADELRLEWAPAAPLAGPGNDVSVYVLEREDQVGAWHQVALVRHAVDDPAYDVAAGRFRVSVAGEGGWRLSAVDDVGNFSRPVYLQQVPRTCSWGVAGVQVPIGYLEAPPADNDCDQVVRALDDARAILLQERLCSVTAMDSELQQLRAVVLADEATIRRQCPGAPRGVRGCYGSTPAGERYLYLRPDAGAALHELAHLCGLRRGGSPDEHPDWERSPRLQELDLRFQEGRRGGAR